MSVRREAKETDTIVEALREVIWIFCLESKWFGFKVFGPWAVNRVGPKLCCPNIVKTRAVASLRNIPLPLLRFRRTSMRSTAAAGAGSGADFPEVLPSPTSPAAAPSHPSPGRHYYLAVDRTQFKMRTLLELLGFVSDRRSGLPIAICVSSRDELDAVCAAVTSLPVVSLSPLYSDQAEAERASILEKFRQATIQWNQTTKATDIAESSKSESLGSKLSIVVTTDACLPLAAMAETPLIARVLINYELPAKKETYSRRMSTCLAADGIVINMVVGGEVATLKALEENSGILIAEMPIHVSEIL